MPRGFQSIIDYRLRYCDYRLRLYDYRLRLLRLHITALTTTNCGRYPQATYVGLASVNDYRFGL